jgi:hypothetical protein
VRGAEANGWLRSSGGMPLPGGSDARRGGGGGLGLGGGGDGGDATSWLTFMRPKRGGGDGLGGERGGREGGAGRSTGSGGG